VAFKPRTVFGFKGIFWKAEGLGNENSGGIELFESSGKTKNYNIQSRSRKREMSCSEVVTGVFCEFIG
jgi:hypothetical protein